MASSCIRPSAGRASVYAILIAGGEAALVRSIEGAEDDAAAGAAAVDGLALGAADVLVAVAASGRTAFTCAVQRARARRGR